MATQLSTFPRVVTIKVPMHISPEDTGNYVTCEAHKILVELGGVVVPRSTSLRPISASLFALTFETHNQFTFKPKDDSSEPNEIPVQTNGKPKASSIK